MEKELIVKSSPTEVEIALLEDKELVEIHSQKTNNQFVVGDVFLGTIKKLMPGLNAAFVDLGHRKDAFLHYTDLGPQIKTLIKFTSDAQKGKLNTHRLNNYELERDNSKHGKIDKVFDKNVPVLVQVLKEPISTKGPRLSCEITIPGRFLVITPFSDVIAISKKIANNDERKRLKLLIESIKPKKFGVIVRTAAEGKKVADLHEELRTLEENWQTMYDQLVEAQGPMKLLSELDKTSSMLRDILSDSFNRIVVDDKAVYANMKNFLGSIAPEKKKIVTLYKGKGPVFDAYGVTKQIKTSFGKTATMRSGAYLVIEHTEAMHVVDVNSGPKMKNLDQETAALQVNLEAGKEIGRQLRLRDIGGLIIIDFIDMRSGDNRSRLLSVMREAMKNDRAQHTILPLSKFGLMQITRQRVRPEVSIDTSEKCPSCNGSGKINPSILLADRIDRDMETIMNSRPKSKIVLKAHPYIAAYIGKGRKSLKWQWFKQYFKWVKIEENFDYSFDEYKFYDGNDDEIRLN